MDFKIVQNIKNHSFIENIKNLTLNYFGGFIAVLGLVILPLILIWMFFLKIFSRKEDEVQFEHNKWKEFLTSDKIKIFRRFINENDLPDDMDIPEDCNDIYSFNVKSEPRIEQLENIIFDYHELETERGFYLISFNKIGEQMSLWFIDKTSLEIKIVTKLKPLWWDLTKNNSKIILKATEYKKDHILEIEEI